jgi:hypothetical protein
MLEELQNLIRQHAGDAIINNPAIPNEKNDEAVSDASNAIVAGLKGAVANGNVDGVVDLFKNGANSAGSSPVTHNITAGYAQDLIHKFGINQGQASSIAGSLIPMVLSKFVHKTNDPNDKSFDLSNIITHLTGGAGLGDILGKFTGGGGNSANNSSDEGGLMGKIKGMFS